MKKKNNVCVTVFMIYVLCYVFRIWEYFVLRTDQTMIGEAFIHKIIGILILLGAMKYFKYSFEEIGIKKQGAIKYTIGGLVFGLSIYVIGYAAEVGICMATGSFQNVRFYVSSYAVDTTVAMDTGWIFLVICIVGNIINVMMEEGLFRGLFQRMLLSRYSFVVSALISSVLFGFWHIMGPLRNYVDGVSSLNGTVANVLMLLISSGLIGFKFAMMSRLEGALYMGMADHFVNNAIVNLVHVTTDTGVDELMFARITIAQTISFIIILLVFLKKRSLRNSL